MGIVLIKIDKYHFVWSYLYSIHPKKKNSKGKYMIKKRERLWKREIDVVKIEWKNFSKKLKTRAICSTCLEWEELKEDEEDGGCGGGIGLLLWFEEIEDEERWISSNLSNNLLTLHMIISLHKILISDPEYPFYKWKWKEMRMSWKMRRKWEWIWKSENEV